MPLSLDGYRVGIAYTSQSSSRDSSVCVYHLHNTLRQFNCLARDPHTGHRSCSRTRAYRQGSVCGASIIHHHNTLGHDPTVMPDTRDRPSPEGWIFGNVSPRYKSTLHMRPSRTRTGINLRLILVSKSVLNCTLFMSKMSSRRQFPCHWDRPIS